jgi:trk system potassium uptake protein TrkA
VAAMRRSPPEVGIMRMLVVGAGEVGTYIAGRLVREGHDLIVLDKSAAAVERLRDLDVAAVEGDGTRPEVLRENGVRSVDLVLAVSNDEATNLVACGFAMRMGAARTVARLSSSNRTPEDERLAREAFGIDAVINPDEEAAREIAGLLEGRQVTDSAEFDQGRVRLVGVRVDEESPLANQNLSDIRTIHEGANVLVVGIVRDGATIIPRGDHRILPGDRVYMIGARAELEYFLRRADSAGRARRVLIVGGGSVGERVAARLEKTGASVRVLERDPDRSALIADVLERATVLQGDGRNLSELRESGVQDVDGFVAVSGDEETNIMSALLARHLGARKVIALVKRPDYIPVLQEIGLDAAVNPRLTAAAAILRFVRRGHIMQVTAFMDLDAEVLELATAETARIIGKPLRDVKFPRDAILGGHMRGEEFSIPDGETVLEPHDRVIVFALPSAIPKVEKLLS